MVTYRMNVLRACWWPTASKALVASNGTRAIQGHLNALPLLPAKEVSSERIISARLWELVNALDFVSTVSIRCVHAFHILLATFKQQNKASIKPRFRTNRSYSLRRDAHCITSSLSEQPSVLLLKVPSTVTLYIFYGMVSRTRSDVNSPTSYLMSLISKLTFFSPSARL